MTNELNDDQIKSITARRATTVQSYEFVKVMNKSIYENITDITLLTDQIILKVGNMDFTFKISSIDTIEKTDSERYAEFADGIAAALKAEYAATKGT